MISPTWGKLTIPQVIVKVKEYMNKYGINDEWKMYCGTDSQRYGNDCVIYATALVLHHCRKGAIYFFNKLKCNEKISTQERMYKEACMSLEFSEMIMKEIRNNHLEHFINNKNFEIHVDIGLNGESKNAIAGVLGMIKGSGYTVHIKPFATAASIVADRKTKNSDPLTRSERRKLARVEREKKNKK